MAIVCRRCVTSDKASLIAITNKKMAVIPRRPKNMMKALSSLVANRVLKTTIAEAPTAKGR